MSNDAGTQALPAPQVYFTTSGGEPPEPQKVRPTQVTDGERLLYGDFAPIVRDLGTAVAAVHQAARTLGAYLDEGRAFVDELPRARERAETQMKASELVHQQLASLGAAQRSLVRYGLASVEQDAEALAVQARKIG